MYAHLLPAMFISRVCGTNVYVLCSNALNLTCTASNRNGLLRASFRHFGLLTYKSIFGNLVLRYLFATKGREEETFKYSVLESWNCPGVFSINILIGFLEVELAVFSFNKLTGSSCEWFNWCSKSILYVIELILKDSQLCPIWVYHYVLLI